MKRHYDQIYLYVAIAGLVLLVGCGSGKTLVMAPPAAKVQVATVDVAEGNLSLNAFP